MIGGTLIDDLAALEIDLAAIESRGGQRASLTVPPCSQCTREGPELELKRAKLKELSAQVALGPLEILEGDPGMAGVALELSYPKKEVGHRVQADLDVDVTRLMTGEGGRNLKESQNQVEGPGALFPELLLEAGLTNRLDGHAGRGGGEKARQRPFQLHQRRIRDHALYHRAESLLSRVAQPEALGGGEYLGEIVDRHPRSGRGALRNGVGDLLH